MMLKAQAKPGMAANRIPKVSSPKTEGSPIFMATFPAKRASIRIRARIPNSKAIGVSLSKCPS